MIKYGEVIGTATEDIGPGQWVHVHNMQFMPTENQCALATDVPPAPQCVDGRTFRGYRRASGRVGTRNYIGVISSVNCSASVSRAIARYFDPDRLREFPNVDGVISCVHQGGCGMQFGGIGHEMLNRVLAGFAQSPNIGGYLLVGLGCEQADISYLIDQHRLVSISTHGGLRNTEHRPPVLTIQELGGTRKTVEAGIQKVAELLPRVNAFQRETCPASQIVLATECGGSDAASGITANPALGMAADHLVACGGTVILGETPEIFGAEHLLTRRAISEDVARKLIERIQWWRGYTGIFGVTMNNNPSVGNKEGGLTTIAEKSLGAIAKGGSTALVDVYQYAEPVTAKGLVVMDTPGYDPPSVTGMIAGGANVVVFTTGRGSCFGSKPAPTIKVASNTRMYGRMREDMDLNAGVVLEGESIATVGQTILDEILAVASGKKTCSERVGQGDDEFVPWIVGPVL